jgi:hypothetical protein
MDMLVLAFIACCLASAALQLVAWLRHSKQDGPTGFRALWKPEERFDEIGVRQIGLARRLLFVGGVAYLSYGFFMLAIMISRNLS